MRSIKIEHVKKSFHGELILENLNLTIPSGKFFALLGPSGSGKTTVLRLIAGFEQPDAGRIFLGNHDITMMPINERRINTVFQHYALFPHMNVFDNVAYGLRIKKVPHDVIEQKVVKILRAVHLEKQIYKSIHQLSGGQQQRVALARAIVNEPEVLLLDEPLAALDVKLREAMLLELIELQDTLKTTFVYVTHDQLEALTVADYMAIMNQDGEIEQVGTPKEIYEFPVSSFVATFVGSTNLFQGTLQLQDGSPKIEVPGLGLFEISLHKNPSLFVLTNEAKPQEVLNFAGLKRDWVTEGRRIVMSIRPEKFEISKQPLQGFSNCLKGTVKSIVYHGRSTQYNVRLSNDMIVQVFEQNEEHFPQEVIDYDDTVYLYWQKENVVLLER
ncbi:MAG: ABC transporter ATP-binding protein [Candidatus Babeliales bacterium]